MGDDNLRRRIGMTRRDLLRRGAIVGGTLIWTVPVIKTLSQADTKKGSLRFFCCWCTKKGPKPPKSPGPKFKCISPAPDNREACRAACGAGYATHFHHGPKPFSCTSKGCTFK